MGFNNRLYELRKQKGLSQEELAGRINVSRQTVSKWEIGDSTPDMEKLIALSDLFEISLDELIKGECSDVSAPKSDKSEVLNILEEKIFTTDNKQKAKKGLKVAGIAAAVILSIDFLTMIIYFILYGIPK